MSGSLTCQREKRRTLKRARGALPLLLSQDKRMMKETSEYAHTWLELVVKMSHANVCNKACTCLLSLLDVEIIVAILKEEEESTAITVKPVKAASISFFFFLGLRHVELKVRR